MKITENQKIQIKELRLNGKQIKEIAAILGLTQGIVSYWLYDKCRKNKNESAKSYYKNLSEQKKKEYSDKRKDYRTKYYKKRYDTDEEYRLKKIQSSIKWKRKQNTIFKKVG